MMNTQSVTLDRRLKGLTISRGGAAATRRALQPAGQRSAFRTRLRGAGSGSGIEGWGLGLLAHISLQQDVPNFSSRAGTNEGKFLATPHVTSTRIHKISQPFLCVLLQCLFPDCLLVSVALCLVRAYQGLSLWSMAPLLPLLVTYKSLNRFPDPPRLDPICLFPPQIGFFTFPPCTLLPPGLYYLLGPHRSSASCHRRGKQQRGVHKEGYGVP